MIRSIDAEPQRQRDIEPAPEAGNRRFSRRGLHHDQADNNEAGCSHPHE